MLIRANALQIPLRDESVQCVVTSPPYWSLRDYALSPTVWGGDPGCDHSWATEQISTEVGGGNWAQAVNGRGELQTGGLEEKRKPIEAVAERGFCQRCGAWLGCLGLEPTPDLYVDHLVEIFRDVRRVLRADGTLWLNIGDSYVTRPHGRSGANTWDPRYPAARHRGNFHSGEPRNEDSPNRRPQQGIKNKDLVGIPWMVAFALRADGWRLRSEIVWHKPSAMPESVRDRPTRAHEQVFLLSRSARYVYDREAASEPVTGGAKPRGKASTPKAKPPAGWDRSEGSHRDLVGRYPQPRIRNNRSFERATKGHVDRRNWRSVWTIPSEPYPGAHYATYPTALVRRCILAGCPTGGVVLDPFAGSGTTVRVARDLGREGIGLDLSRPYLHEQARERIQTTRGLAL